MDEWDEPGEDIIIERNYIERNLVGVSVYRSEHITARNNYINSSYVAGIEVFKAKDTTITYNTLSYNPYGVYVCSSKPTNIINRFIFLFTSNHSIQQQQKGFDDNNNNYHGFYGPFPVLDYQELMVWLYSFKLPISEQKDKRLEGIEIGLLMLFVPRGCKRNCLTNRI